MLGYKLNPRSFPVDKNWEVRTTGAGNEYLQYTLENITYHKNSLIYIALLFEPSLGQLARTLWDFLTYFDQAVMNLQRKLRCASRPQHPPTLLISSRVGGYTYPISIGRQPFTKIRGCNKFFQSCFSGLLCECIPFCSWISFSLRCVVYDGRV